MVDVAAAMRGQHNVRQLQQRIVPGQRFGMEHIQPSRGDAPLGKRMDQRVAINQRGPGGIHQHRFVLHQP